MKTSFALLWIGVLFGISHSNFSLLGIVMETIAMSCITYATYRMQAEMNGKKFHPLAWALCLDAGLALMLLSGVAVHRPVILIWIAASILYIGLWGIYMERMTAMIVNHRNRKKNMISFSLGFVRTVLLIGTLMTMLLYAYELESMELTTTLLSMLPFSLMRLLWVVVLNQGRRATQ